MTTVVGIDPSLAATGISIIKHPSFAGTPNIPTVLTVGTGPTSDLLTERARRVGFQAHRIWRALPDSVALVAIEGLPRHKPEASTLYVERGALVLRLAEAFAQKGIPVVEVSATTLKLWATGNGRSDKTAVHTAMSELWPHARLNKANGNPDDNKSDSLALATIAAQKLGWYEPEFPHHYAPKVDWPKGIR